MVLQPWKSPHTKKVLKLLCSTVKKVELARMNTLSVQLVLLLPPLTQKAKFTQLPTFSFFFNTPQLHIDIHPPLQPSDILFHALIIDRGKYLSYFWANPNIGSLTDSLLITGLVMKWFVHRSRLAKKCPGYTKTSIKEQK